MFNKQFAEQYVNKLLTKHKITVYAWSASSCGKAIKKQRKIKIPKPTNVDRFGVCLHEIFHITGRKGSASFEKEFYCDKYALDILRQLSYPTDEWVRRMKWHVLSRIAMAHNRGLNHAKINAEIREFFKEVDFSKWVGKKVYAGHKYYQTNNPADVEIYENISFYDVSEYLKELGLKIIKSQYDDSTYGNYIVSKTEDFEKYGEEFDCLKDVIVKYDLSSLKEHYKIAV